nr:MULTISPECIES: acetylxylan esterase [unclassified Actinomyces]
MSPDQLEVFNPEVPEPTDLDAFWARTLDESPADPGSVTTAAVDTPLCTVTVHDVTFTGYAGDPVRAWLILPATGTDDAPLPTVVEYLGMGGGRGLPHDHLTWASAGYAHLVVDTRGQGSHWGSGGDTPDPHGHGPATAGFATHGIEDPEHYLYRRLFVDAHHAVVSAAALPRVDASRIAVTGGSQGGALAIAAVALGAPAVAAMPDVPFLANIPRAVGMTAEPPYADIVTYLSVHRDAVDQVLRTLSYFDVAALARRARVPALFSTALMDMVCPPSTVFTARNKWGEMAPDGERPDLPQVRVYPFNGHEGGESYQWREKVAWLDALLGR